jgi:Na+/proline symporter
MTQETNPRRAVIVRPPRRKRLSSEDIEARVRALLILTLAGVLGLSVLALLYSLIFVYQPAEQSPNDAAFLKILEPLMFSIGGALTGLAAGRAVSSAASRREDEQYEDAE